MPFIIYDVEILRIVDFIYQRKHVRALPTNIMYFYTLSLFIKIIYFDCILYKYCNDTTADSISSMLLCQKK